MARVISQRQRMKTVIDHTSPEGLAVVSGEVAVGLAVVTAQVARPSPGIE